MLDYLRQRSQSAVIIFFVAIISAVFIINFGPQSQGCGAEGTIWLAKVHGRTLTIGDFRWVERLVRGRYRLPRDYVESRQFADDVLQGLIERELLAREARRAGLAAGDDDVIRAVLDRNELHFSWPVESILPLRGPLLVDFRDEDGTMMIDDFREYVIHGLQLSERAFTEQQSQELLAERMRQLVQLNVQLSDEELWSEYAQYSDRVNLMYARVNPAFFREALQVTDDELQVWAREHASAVEERYEADRFRYRNVRKQVRVRDIVISMDEDASDEAQEARRARAAAILALTKAEGADFAAIARCFSDDPRAASKGGDLGYLRRGMSRFGSEFDDAVFDLEPGTISDVIVTKRGLHVVQVLDAREGDIDLAAATLELAEGLYRAERGDARAREVAEAVLRRAAEGAAFDDEILGDLPELAAPVCPALPGQEAPEGAAEEPPRPRPLAPMVRETGFFNRSGLGVPGIGESSELMTSAFELSNESPVADEVVVVRGDLFVIRLAEDGRQGPTRTEFESERPTYERRLLDRKRQEALRTFVAGLRRQADSSGAIVTNDSALRGMVRGRGGEEGESGEGGEEGRGREGGGGAGESAEGSDD